MHRARTATGTYKTTGSWSRASSALLCGRLPGTGSRSLIERLSRARHLRAHGHAGARRRLPRHGRALLLLLAQLGNQIGTRRYDGPRGGLSSQGTAPLRHLRPRRLALLTLLERARLM